MLKMLQWMPKLNNKTIGGSCGYIIKEVDIYMTHIILKNN